MIDGASEIELTPKINKPAREHYTAPKILAILEPFPSKINAASDRKNGSVNGKRPAILI